jgi:hypothetical protein
MAPQAVGSFVISAFLAVGAGGLLPAASAFAIGATVLGLAAGAAQLGLQAYSLSKVRKNVAPLNDQGAIQQVLKQSIPPQRLVLGRATTGGALFFYRAKRPYIWYGILLAAHEIDGFENLFIAGNTVFIGPDGFATSVPFRDGANQYIEVSFRRGTLGQAIDPILARDFPTLPSTYRQRGHATLVIKAHYGFGANFEQRFEDHKRVYGDQGALQPLVRYRGALTPDLRRTGVALGDPSTWVFSDNAAICLARYLTHRWPDTQLVPPDRLNWEAFLRAADECDRWETSKDGTTFRRHTVNGVVQATDDPWDVVENLKTAMGAHVVLDAGKVYPVVRNRREPAGTLHQDMIVGGLTFASEPRDRELANIVKPTFIAPDREFQEVGGPVLRRDDLIAQDGKPREISARGAYVEDHRRMQRIAAAQLAWAREGRTLAVGASIEALSWLPGRIYRVHLTGPLARVNGLYELISKGWDDKLRGYRLSFAGYNPAATDFGPQDEQDFSLDEDVTQVEAA